MIKIITEDIDNLDNIYCIVSYVDTSGLDSEGKEHFGFNPNSDKDYNVLVSFNAESQQDAENKSSHIIDALIKEQKEQYSKENRLARAYYNEGPQEDDIVYDIYSEEQYEVVSAKEAMKLANISKNALITYTYLDDDYFKFDYFKDAADEDYKNGFYPQAFIGNTIDSKFDDMLNNGEITEDEYFERIHGIYDA